MHARACYGGGMATNIHVRAVDDRLAEAAKARAAATHRSLSSYVRDLIEQDIARHESRRAMAALLDEIAADAQRPQVSRSETAAALAAAKREIGAA